MFPPKSAETIVSVHPNDAPRTRSLKSVNPSDPKMGTFLALRPWVLHAPVVMMTVVNINSLERPIFYGYSLRPMGYRDKWGINLCYAIMADHDPGRHLSIVVWPIAKANLITQMVANKRW